MLVNVCFRLMNACLHVQVENRSVRWQSLHWRQVFSGYLKLTLDCTHSSDDPMFSRDILAFNLRATSWGSAREIVWLV